MSNKADDLVQELDDGVRRSLGLGAYGGHHQLQPHLLQHHLQDIGQAEQGQNMNYIEHRQQFHGKEDREEYQEQQQDSLSTNKELVSLLFKILVIFFLRFC